MKQVKITILCENTAGAPMGIIGEHGFSALIEGQEEFILLDTGQGLCIRNNAITLGADLSKVTKVVLTLLQQISKTVRLCPGRYRFYILNRV